MELNEKAMLVNLTISQWTARTIDRKATWEVLEKNGASRDSGRFNKLLVELSSVKRYQRAVNEARTFHYENTLPWSDDGTRILPAANYLKYTAEMRSLKAQFQEAVDDFIQEFPALVKQAQRTLGGLFNPSDYPHPHTLRGKFALDTHFFPLPDRGDFRVQLGADEQKAIQDQITTRVNESVKAAMADTWQRLHGAVKHMTEKLRDKDAIFRDSLIGNIKELCDLLPKLNLTDDPNLTKAIEDAKGALADLDPQELREDEAKRRDAAQAADDILSKMAGYTS
jgi:hypothetical protein